MLNLFKKNMFIVFHHFFFKNFFPKANLNQLVYLVLFVLYNFSIIKENERFDSLQHIQVCITKKLNIASLKFFFIFSYSHIP